jgi:hypothetical protein
VGVVAESYEPYQTEDKGPVDIEPKVVGLTARVSAAVVEELDHDHIHDSLEKVDPSIQPLLEPYVSKGHVSLEGGVSHRRPVQILRDTGSVQTLILQGVLPLAEESSEQVLISDMGCNVESIPLHTIRIDSDFYTGDALVGVKVKWPMKGVDVILGNDIAGKRVETSVDMQAGVQTVPDPHVVLHPEGWT